MYLIKIHVFLSVKKTIQKDRNWYDILVIKSPQYGLDFVASSWEVTDGSLVIKMRSLFCLTEFKIQVSFCPSSAVSTPDVANCDFTSNIGVKNSFLYFHISYD